MDADIALLQEAGGIPSDVAPKVDTGPVEHYDSHHWNGTEWWKGRWTKLFDRWPMVVKLSDRVRVEWFKQVSPIGWPERDDEIPVSGIGTIAAARIHPHDGAPFVVVSMYGRWISPHPTVPTNFKVGYPDGSAHRIISDLSAFIGYTDPSKHRILAAGDLNMAFSGDHSFVLRERTVTDRMDALGLELLGPKSPDGRNVPTHHTTSQTPETATNQLDWVFASRGFHHGVTVRALNDADEWGPSDHCRLLIQVADLPGGYVAAEPPTLRS